MPLKFIYNFNHLTNICHGNLKVIEIASVIEPWLQCAGVLYLPSILLMKFKFNFRRFAPS